MGYVLFIVYSIFFTFFITGTVYGGDGGDFATAAFTGGFAHAPGYPLYSILGYIASKIPFSNPAWRVTLVSAIPAAGTLTYVYLFLRKITGSWFAGLTASLILGGTYVFWLYSVVPEVFILDVFFSILILYVLLLWSKSKNFKTLLLATFLFGLSLTHHHIILFMLPAYLYFVVIAHRDKLPKFSKSNISKLFAVGSAGLLPYLWLPFIAFTVPVYSWGDPNTPIRFMNMVTRAYYGTFIAAQDYNQTIMTRFNQVPTLFGFYIDDFLLVSIVIAVIGGYFLFRKDKKMFLYLLIGFLFSGPIYFMYASYDYSTPYRAAVAERFLLPSYLMLALFIGVGIANIESLVTKRLKAVSKKPLVVYLPLALILFIPLHIGVQTYYKVGILKGDQTAERFAEDILNTSTPGEPAIFLLQNDNSVFNAQYIHHWKIEEYQDRVPLNPAELANGFNHKAIQKYYPGIQTPAYDKYHPISDFIQKNYDNYEIYADLHEDYDHLNGIDEGEWVPYGLVFRYYKEGDIPDPEEIVKINKELWESYQNPLEGSLKYYENLQLAHVLEFYQFGRVRSGIYALENGFSEEALVHLDAYQELAPTLKMKLALIGAANAYMELDNCDDAGSILDTVEDFESDKYYQTMIRFNEQCTQDEDATAYWLEELAAFERRNERGLEEL